MNIQFILFVLLLTSLSSNGQQKYGKNELSFSYFKGITKTNISNFQEISSSNYYTNYLYETARPTQTVLGYSYGGNYLRKINRKLGISLGFRLTKRGQKSPKFRSIVGIPDNSLPEGYGESFYRFTMKSVETPLLLHYDFYQANRLILFSKLGVSTDIYRVFYAEYLIRKTGRNEFQVSSSQTLFNAKTSLLKQLKIHIGEDIVRFGGVGGLGAKFRIFSFFYLKTEFEFSYYGDILRSKSKNPTTIVRGSAYAFGLNSGIIFKF